MLLPVLLLTSTFALIGAPPAESAQAPTTEEAERFAIAYQRFVLPNGLTVIVHEDRSAPVVALQVVYRVGSGHELPGRTGFAHLFEHLFFTGTAHLSEEALLRETRDLGQVERMAITKWESTHFGGTVPTTALDRALWLESERMGHFLSAFSQDKLDRARGVVQNERRRLLTLPYAKEAETVAYASYPEGHPYAHHPIGTEDDLNRATLDEVKAWFGRYYGPNNAILLLVGDIDPATAREKATRYFADIPPGDVPAHLTRWPAANQEQRRYHLQDRAAAPRLSHVWNLPGWGETDTEYVGLARRILDPREGGRFARLTGSGGVASEVSIAWDLRGLGSQLIVHASPAAGISMSTLEQAVQGELRLLRDEGPTEEEVSRARARAVGDFSRGMEVVGQYVDPPDAPRMLRDEGKSAVLGFGELYYRDPSRQAHRVRTVAAATATQVKAAVARWLNAPVAVIETSPVADLRATGGGVDRSVPPALVPPEPAALPPITRFTLENGLNVQVVERRSAPTVQLALVVGVGAATGTDVPSGAASVLADLLGEPSAQSRPGYVEGAVLKSRVSPQHTVLSVATLSDTLEASLALLARRARTPLITAADVERVRTIRLQQIEQQMRTVGGVFGRVTPALLFGQRHPLAVSADDYTPARAFMRQVDAETVHRLHQRWYVPNNATLIVTGGVEAAAVRAHAERHLGSWQRAPVPRVSVARAQPADRRLVYLVDVPGAEQASISAASLLPPSLQSDEDAALHAIDTIMGGGQGSRLTMNLRTEKGWVYFARTYITKDEGPRLFLAYANPQLDKAAPTMREMAVELASLVNERPISDAELTRFKQSQGLLRGTGWHTAQALAATLTEHVQLGRPDDYPLASARAVQALTTERVNEVARRLITPERMVWLVIGDAAKLEPEVRALGFGQVQRVDAEGAPMRTTSDEGR